MTFRFMIRTKVFIYVICLFVILQNYSKDIDAKGGEFLSEYCPFWGHMLNYDVTNLFGI